MADDLERAFRDLGAARRAERPAPPAPGDEAFRATVEERLGHLESQLGDVQRRINGLLFVLLGAVATNLIVGVSAWAPV